MAILRRTNTKDRSLIIREFNPFSNPGQYEGMIIGNDLDSVMCACFLKEMFGWDIAGIYDYHNLWFASEHANFLETIQSNKFVAIDLDIYHENLYSLGHHILEHSSSDLLPKHVRSLNPNLIRGINTSRFKWKYPLGTVHFLLWLFDMNNLPRECSLTVWLADSSFINGQSHRFASNVREWIEHYLALDQFKQMSREIDTRKLEEELSGGILKSLKSIEVCAPSGQVTSRHLKLSGFQCQWNDPNRQHDQIQRLIDFISQITGWTAPSIPGLFKVLNGRRSKISLREVIRQYGSLDNFLEHEGVFSYVFPYNDSINYTTNIL